MSTSFVRKCEFRNPPSPEPRRVLVTGAAGSIGSYFAESCADRYALTLMVHSDQDASHVEHFGEVKRGNLENLDELRGLCEGMDTVLHLAANPDPGAGWQTLHRDNVQGTYNLFTAAVASKCRRVVFASPIHAVSGYPLSHQVQTEDPVNPGDIYGVSKCFGEAMGRFMAIQHGVSVIAVRIGAFQPLEAAHDPGNTRMMNAFVSKRDLNLLLCCCIDNQDLQFAIVHGLSNNRFNRMDISDTCELLGYAPEDDFTVENPALEKLHLPENIHPHSESGG